MISNKQYTAAGQSALGLTALGQSQSSLRILVHTTITTDSDFNYTQTGHSFSFSLRNKVTLNWGREGDATRSFPFAHMLK